MSGDAGWDCGCCLPAGVKLVSGPGRSLMVQRSWPLLVLGVYGRLSEYPRPVFMKRERDCVCARNIDFLLLSSTAAPELSAGPSMSRGVGLRGFVDKWTEPLWGKPTWSPLIFYFKISQSLLGSCNGKKKRVCSAVPCPTPGASCGAVGREDIS